MCKKNFEFSQVFMPDHSETDFENEILMQIDRSITKYINNTIICYG